MGTVYLVEDQQLYGKQWALKEMVFSAAFEDQATAINQFRQEARVLVGLSHPNLPHIVAVFSENNREYLVMEYVQGQSLQQTLARYPNGIPQEQVLPWSQQLCDVLVYLHSQKPPIIYRDLKPSNIMVTDQGWVMLIDFGIARFFNPNKQRDTVEIGTAGYAPPEQYGRGQTDARSDVFSLAATLHYLLSGQDPSSQPFRFQPLDQLSLGIDPRVSQAIDRALAYDPKDRFQAAADFKAALDVRPTGSKGDATWYLPQVSQDRPAATVQVADYAPMPIPQGTVQPTVVQHAGLHGTVQQPAMPSGPPPLPFPVAPAGHVTAPHEKRKGGIPMWLVAGVGIVAVIALLATGAFAFDLLPFAAKEEPDTPTPTQTEEVGETREAVEDSLSITQTSEAMDDDGATAEALTQEAQVATRVQMTRDVESTASALELMNAQATQTAEAISIQATTEAGQRMTAEAQPTATPLATETPTTEPSPTSPPTAAVTRPPPTPVRDIKQQLIDAMWETRRDIESLGGQIDNAVQTGYINCREFVTKHDEVANSPTFDTSGSSGAVRDAYDSYRRAITVLMNGVSDMVENCRGQSGSIPFSQWGPARQSINDSLDILNPALERLERS